MAVAFAEIDGISLAQGFNMSKINMKFIKPSLKPSLTTALAIGCFSLALGFVSNSQAELTAIAKLSSPELEILKMGVQSGLPAQGSLQLFTDSLKKSKINSAASDQDEELLLSLTERINAKMKLDLTVIQYSPIFCAETMDSNLLNAKVAVDFFLPYDSEFNALGAGLQWKQENIDLATSQLIKIISGCQFQAAQIQMVGDNNVSLSFLSILDPRTAEILLLGFFSK